MVNSNAGVWCAALVVLGVGGWLAGTAAASQSAIIAEQLQAQQVAPPETALAQALTGTAPSTAPSTIPSTAPSTAPSTGNDSAPDPAAGSKLSAPNSPLSAASTRTVSAVGTEGFAAHISSTWLAKVAAQTGIPSWALRGYAGAAFALSIEQPGCHLGWTTLASLGNIESGHGTHAGSALGVDGVARPSIFGPELSGGAFGAIRDTDDGTLDGDPVWDRAVGPLQFIPSTWKRWGADGNGDGVSDPQQIDDAALAAGRYLCHYGHLETVTGWRAAIFGYNHSTVYVDDVANVANDYAGRIKQG